MINVFIVGKYYKIWTIKNFLVNKLEQSVKCRMWVDLYKKYFLSICSKIDFGKSQKKLAKKTNSIKSYHKEPTGGGGRERQMVPHGRNRLMDWYKSPHGLVRQPPMLQYNGHILLLKIMQLNEKNMAADI